MIFWALPFHWRLCLSCTEADCVFARPIFLRQNLNADKPRSLVPSNRMNNSTMTIGTHLRPRMSGQGFREECLHHRQETALSWNSGPNGAGGGSTAFLKSESATRSMIASLTVTISVARIILPLYWALQSHQACWREAAGVPLCSRAACSLAKILWWSPGKETKKSQTAC